MRYLAWAAFYEGGSDALYLDVLIPRILRDLIEHKGVDLVEVPDAPAVRLGQAGRSIDAVAAEACRFSRAFDIVFIHADTGGRALEENLDQRSVSYCQAMRAICDWPEAQCITVTPRHETEAWLLADGRAVISAFGYEGTPAEVGLPTTAQAAERLIDPKATLVAAAEAIRGRRRRYNIDITFPAIAQRQDLNTLRGSASFASFEMKLESCLRSLTLIV